MGWSVGYDEKWRRDIGYGVPAICDHPDCNAEIDRGLSYVCGDGPFGGEYGCGLYFCGEHLYVVIDGKHPRRPMRCDRCNEDKEPFEPKPDVQEWTDFKMTDESWAQWRAEQGIVNTDSQTEKS